MSNVPNHLLVKKEPDWYKVFTMLKLGWMPLLDNGRIWEFGFVYIWNNMQEWNGHRLAIHHKHSSVPPLKYVSKYNKLLDRSLQYLLINI